LKKERRRERTGRKKVGIVRGDRRRDRGDKVDEIYKFVIHNI
jgi:hypothetical protein